MTINDKLKTELDENRLLILGTRIMDPRLAVLTGCLFFLIAIASWYVLAFALRKRERKMPERQSGGATD
jgi:hypothetical protein